MEWVKDAVLALAGLAVTVFIFLSKKRDKKFDAIDKDFDDLWDYAETVKKEKDAIDKAVISLSKEVEMVKNYTERQFAMIDCSQKELREFSMKQGEEIKGLIQNLADKLDKYFACVHDLNINVVKHMDKTGDS